MTPDVKVQRLCALPCTLHTAAPPLKSPAWKVTTMRLAHQASLPLSHVSFPRPLCLLIFLQRHVLTGAIVRINHAIVVFVKGEWAVHSPLYFLFLFYCDSQ